MNWEGGISFARHDHFGAVTESAEEFFAVLPAQAELKARPRFGLRYGGDVHETKLANNICEEISLGFVEVGVHYRALGPIHQLCLTEFAVKVVADFSATIWRVIFIGVQEARSDRTEMSSSISSQ